MSELQPDITLLRPRADFYSRAHPGAADVLFLLEVADATLRLDRRVKIPLYARAGVAEAWLLDLTTEHLVRLERGASLAPHAFPDLALVVDALLG
jgi:Putative restriction endonuclease